MFIHLLFENIYTKFLIAFIMSVILTFVDRIEVLKSIYMFYCLLIIIICIILSNVYNDYGLLLLLIALLVMCYVNIFNKRYKRSKLIR